MAHDALAMIEYGDEPSVLLFADSEAAAARARRTAERAGCRIADVAGIAGAAERLDRQAAADAILVEIGGEGEGIEPLLDRLQAEAGSGRRRSIVSAPFALIDLVAARAGHRDVVHLSDASEAERVTTLALAARPRPARLHDVGRGHAPELLQQLSEEVGRIASILASLSEEDGAAPAAPGRTGQGDADVDAAYVRAIIRARRLRDQYFPTGLFADPAWDMLLDLMAARLEGSRVAVSSLCIAAAVPATTALRWIKTLTDQGLFVRSADPQDGRRVYIALSEEAAGALAAYLRAARRIAPAPI